MLTSYVGSSEGYLHDSQIRAMGMLLVIVQNQFLCG